MEGGQGEGGVEGGGTREGGNNLCLPFNFGGNLD